eukprot:3062308-Pyramimonas_sp.AAC.1
MATTLIRVYRAECYDSIPLPIGTGLDVYIDDQGLSAAGKSRFVVSSIVAGASSRQGRSTRIRLFFRPRQDGPGGQLQGCGVPGPRAAQSPLSKLLAVSSQPRG